MDVYTFEFWAHSLTDKGFGTEVPVKQNVVRFKTIYLARRRYGPRATAQICLSRLDGDGTARCGIQSYSFFSPATPDPLYVSPGAYSGPTDSLAIVLAGPSAVSVGSVHSITFQLGVSNMFAYATATIFAEPLGLFEGAVRTFLDAIRIVPRLDRGAAADTRGALMATHVVYDLRTGDVLGRHDAVAVGGARLPDAARLAQHSAELLGPACAVSQHLAVTSLHAHMLEDAAAAPPPDVRRLDLRRLGA